MPICFEKNEERDEIFSELVRNRIKPRKYFFPLIVDFDYLKNGKLDLVERYNLRVATDIAGKILCLPIYPDLNVEAADEISNIIEGYFR